MIGNSRNMAGSVPVEGAMSDAAPPGPTQLRRQQLTALAAIGLGVAALLTIFWDTAISIERTWAGSDLFGHGFLILPITAFLLWRRRAALRQLVPTTSLLGLAVIAVMAVGWLLGDLAAASVVKQFALVGMIQGLVLAVLGVQATRIILFPLAYLYFGAPVGAFLIEPLQDVTAEFVVAALRMTGIPVYLDGLLIHIASGSFEVAAACSGTRFLISTVALSTLGANLFYRSLRRRALFMALAVIVPIIANGIRAYGIVMIADLSNYRWGVGEDHVTMGMIFMSMVTLGLLFVGMSMREPGRGDLLAEDPRDLRIRQGVAVRRTGLVGMAIGAVIVAAAAPGYTGVVGQRSVAAAPPALAAPTISAPWAARETPDERWHPSFAGTDAEVFRTFVAGDKSVDFYFAFYDGLHRQ